MPSATILRKCDDCHRVKPHAAHGWCNNCFKRRYRCPNYEAEEAAWTDEMVELCVAEQLLCLPDWWDTDATTIGSGSSVGRVR